MALSAGEQISGGEVRDADGRMVVIMDTSGGGLKPGEVISGGEVRDPDGRRVVRQGP